MSERRFTEDEVAEILKYAAEAQDSSTSLMAPSTGLTLTELNEIGREVGISPEAMQHAVRKVGTPPAQPVRRFLGFPIGVARSVDIERKLSDDEWERIVADLRTTFDARGVLRQEGSLRSWSNGNLHVMLEPTATGQRLRMRTVKGDAPGLIGGGLGIAGIGSAVFTIAAAAGSLGNTGLLEGAGLVVAGGVGMFAAGAARLSGWARIRQRQMDEIAERVATEYRPAEKRLS